MGGLTSLGCVHGGTCIHGSRTVLGAPPSFSNLLGGGRGLLGGGSGLPDGGSLLYDGGLPLSLVALAGGEGHGGDCLSQPWHGCGQGGRQCSFDVATAAGSMHVVAGSGLQWADPRAVAWIRRAAVAARGWARRAHRWAQGDI